MVKLFLNHPYIIGLGLLICFFSGYGQTYLLSLFNNDLMKECGVSRSTLGLCYSLATFIAAFMIPYFGKLLDRISILYFTLITGFLVFVGMLSLAFAVGPITIFLGYFIVRGAGQGTMGLISTTMISKQFGKHRGKALGLVMLGRPIAEGILPILVTLSLVYFGHSLTFIMIGASIFILFYPFTFFLIKKSFKGESGMHLKPIYDDVHKCCENEENQQEWTFKIFLDDKRLLLVTLTGLILPFVLTGLFFQQSALASYKSIELIELARAFSVYAIFQIAASLFGGHLIDLFSARKLLFITLLPLLASLVVLNFYDGSNWHYLYLGLAGLSVGFSGNIRSAFLAEAYGITFLGGLKGLNSTLVIISTSLSPFLYGFLLDLGVTIPELVNALILLTFVGVACNFYAVKLYSGPVAVNLK